MADNLISDIKNMICREIVNNEAIISALDINDEHEDIMFYYIFPSLRRPETELEKRTFICMRANSTARPDGNDFYKDITVSIYVITHDELQYPKNGIAAGCTRTDFIAEQIESLFKKNPMGLTDSTFISNTEEQVDARHPMRIVTFKTTGLNYDNCK